MWLERILAQKKSVDVLHTNDKWTEKEIREIIPFTIATNNIKYFVTLTKQIKDLYDKNFKSLKEKKRGKRSEN